MRVFKSFIGTRTRLDGHAAPVEVHLKLFICVFKKHVKFFRLFQILNGNFRKCDILELNYVSSTTHMFTFFELQLYYVADSLFQPTCWQFWTWWVVNISVKMLPGKTSTFIDSIASEMIGFWLISIKLRCTKRADTIDTNLKFDLFCN